MTRKVILNADDFGYDPAVTQGIVLAMREGVVSSTTMMVNSPWSDDAITAAKTLSVGLHVNLVSFRAVSDQSIEQTVGMPLSIEWVVKETRAQLRRFEGGLGRRPTHLDVHKHAHREPSVLKGLIEVARQFELPVRSIDDSMRDTLRLAGVQTNDTFIGDTGPKAWWTLQRWHEVLDQLPITGVVELMCHPGHTPSHVTSSYGPQREDELRTFLSPECRQALHDRGLILSRWG